MHCQAQDALPHAPGSRGGRWALSRSHQISWRARPRGGRKGRWARGHRPRRRPAAAAAAAAAFALRCRWAPLQLGQACAHGATRGRPTFRAGWLLECPTSPHIGDGNIHARGHGMRRARARARTHAAHVHKRLRAVHACMHTCMHACVRTYASACTRASMPIAARVHACHPHTHHHLEHRLQHAVLAGRAGHGTRS